MARQKYPDNIFDNEKPSAVEKLTGGKQSPQTPIAPPKELVQSTEKKQTRNLKPLSIYLPQSEIERLDDLAYLYNKREKTRVNRNDLLRHLVKMADIGSFDSMTRD